MNIKVKKLAPDAVIPTKGYKGDLGLDLYSIVDATIKPNETVKIQTGIAIEPPEGIGVVIKDRSSIALKGIYTGAGVIDNGYRGEISVVMTNLGKKDFTVFKGMKIAQMIVIKISDVTISEADEISQNTDRLEQGFGSTGL